MALNLSASPLPVMNVPETMDLERLILESVAPAACTVVARLPPLAFAGERFNLAGCCADFGSPTPMGYYPGELPLPRDFFRLVSFRMSDWHTTLYPLPSDSPAAKLPANGPDDILRYADVGNPWRPTCRILPAPVGFTLSFSACLTPHATVAEALYWPCPAIDEGGGLEFPERSLDQLVQQIKQDIQAVLHI